MERINERVQSLVALVSENETKDACVFPSRPRPWADQTGRI